VLDRERCKAFERDGYLLVSQAFSQAQVAELRSALTRIFDSPLQLADQPKRPGPAAGVRMDICARYPELRWLLVHPPMLGALRSLLGDDFVFLPEMSAHDSGFGGWHKDTTAQEKAGLHFHWDPDYLMVEAAIYLQDNNQFGGGLEAIPGSHRKPDRYVGNGLGFVDKVRDKLDALRLLPMGRSLPSRAGDLLLFDFRIDHRATYPRVDSPAPPEQRKLAIFFACSRNNRHAASYRDYISSRPDYGYMKDHRYPDELTKLAAERGISLIP